MKPKITCHIMGSVDGRILVDRWSRPFGETSMSDFVNVYRETGQSLNTDAWTFGKNTTLEIFPEKFNKPQHTSLSKCTERVFKSNRSSNRMFISIDPEADICYPSNTLREADILVVIDESASQEYMNYLHEKAISYIVVADITDLRSIFENINQEFDITSISLQGGGVFDGGMLSQGLIDELSYVVYPGIDGTSDSVSIFNYMGHDAINTVAHLSLELLSVEVKACGAVWLRYKIHAK